MSAVDILLLVLVAGAVVLAVRSIRKGRKRGGCGCGCAGCTADCGDRKTERK